MCVCAHVRTNLHIHLLPTLKDLHSEGPCKALPSASTRQLLFVSETVSCRQSGLFIFSKHKDPSAATQNPHTHMLKGVHIHFRVSGFM